MQLLAMMSVMALGTVMVSTLPAQAGDQPQPANLATDNSTAQTGINFSNSPSRNVAAIPTKVVTVEEVAGRCAGGFFMPTFLSENSSPEVKLSPAPNSGSPVKLNNGSPFNVLTTPQSTPASSLAEKLAALPKVSVSYTTRTSTTEGELQAFFVSGTTPPSSGLRVRIENVTPGMEGVAPYSDREYHEGSLSEKFTVRFGNRHDSAYLAVREGDNEFTYQIKRGDRIVESGKFKARVDRQIKTETRSISWEQKNRGCQLQNLPSTNPNDSIKFQNERIREQIEQLQKLNRTRIQFTPPPIRPFFQPPQLPIQQQFQLRQPVIPSIPSPILTNPLLQR